MSRDLATYAEVDPKAFEMDDNKCYSTHPLSGGRAATNNVELTTGATPSAQAQPAYQPQPQALVVQFPPQHESVTALMQQPMPMVITVQHPMGPPPAYTIGAMVFSIITTVTLFFLGCLWTLPCTVVGLILAITSTEARDVKTAKTHAGVSIGFSVFAWFTAVCGLTIILASTLGVIYSYRNRYYYY